MNLITANELKTKGVSVLQEALKSEPETMISVRGKPTFVVMHIEQYEQMREHEIYAAWQEAKSDVKKGKHRKESAQAHIKRISKKH